MTHDELVDSLASESPSKEALEHASDAVSFVQTLHNMFSANQMTTSSEPDLNELENLIDSVYGELAAACIFLSEQSFARVPDILRVVEQKIEAEGAGIVHPVVTKGYGRLATRIENTRVAMQQLAKSSASQTA